MNTTVFFHTIVEPTLQFLHTIPEVNIKPTNEARMMVMTIAGQESDWKWRRQVGGPARSFWQFEQYGGVAEVFQKTPKQLRAVCDLLNIPFNALDVFEAMAWNDRLACTMARLLLFQDAKALPALGDLQTSWDYYQRNWRPGAPHPEKWSTCYDMATEAMSSVFDPKQLKLV